MGARRVFRETPWCWKQYAAQISLPGSWSRGFESRVRLFYCELAQWSEHRLFGVQFPTDLGNQCRLQQTSLLRRGTTALFLIRV